MPAQFVDYLQQMTHTFTRVFKNTVKQTFKIGSTKTDHHLLFTPITTSLQNTLTYYQRHKQLNPKLTAVFVVPAKMRVTPILSTMSELPLPQEFQYLHMRVFTDVPDEDSVFHSTFPATL